MQFYHPGKKCGNFCLVCKKINYLSLQQIAATEDSWRLQVLDLESRGLVYPCSGNKGADKLHGYREAEISTAKLKCAFVFAYACCWFSYAGAQILQKHAHAIYRFLFNSYTCKN